MSELSVSKLNEYKKSKHLTNKRISEITGIAHVTIDSIFSGKNKNPTVMSLLKISRALGCLMDDLIDYDENSPLKDYSIDKKNSMTEQEADKNARLKNIAAICGKLNEKDVKLLADIALRFSSKQA